MQSQQQVANVLAFVAFPCWENIKCIIENLNTLDVPGIPPSLQLETNESCVFLTASKPDIPNGIIVSYNVSISGQFMTLSYTKSIERLQ